MLTSVNCFKLIFLSILKAIIDIINYLHAWRRKELESKANRRGRRNDGRQENFYMAVTKSTLTGLLISLKSTLELLDYLCGKCGYKYLMTARLNQDQLEVHILKHNIFHVSICSMCKLNFRKLLSYYLSLIVLLCRNFLESFEAPAVAMITPIPFFSVKFFVYYAHIH